MLKCASTGGILVKRNETITVPAKVVKMKCFRSCLAMVHPSDRATLPVGAEIMPVMIDCKGGETDIPVEISNLTNRPLRVGPHSYFANFKKLNWNRLNLKRAPNFHAQTF